MVQQAQVCLDCGKPLGYLAGLRGFGLRERRHAARCLARTGVAMASVESFIRMSAATKDVHVEDTQVPCTIPQQAKECMKLSPSPVSRRSAIMSPEGMHNGSEELLSPPLVPCAMYFSANFRTSPASVWEQLYAQFPEAPKSAGPQRTTEAETLEDVQKRWSADLFERPLGKPLGKATLSGKTYMRHFASGTWVEFNTLEGNTGKVTEQCNADSMLPRSLTAAFASGDLASAASMLTAALASGDPGLAAALDQVTEKGVLTFHYTWLQHSQTPLPQRLENERKRLGINDHEWQSHFSITDSKGFCLDASDPLQEDHFPARVEIKPRSSRWYSPS